jgi:hypothetical protein
VQADLAGDKLPAAKAELDDEEEPKPKTDAEAAAQFPGTLQLVQPVAKKTGWTLPDPKTVNHAKFTLQRDDGAGAGAELRVGYSHGAYHAFSSTYRTDQDDGERVVSMGPRLNWGGGINFEPDYLPAVLSGYMRAHPSPAKADAEPPIYVKGEGLEAFEERLKDWEDDRRYEDKSPPSLNAPATPERVASERSIAKRSGDALWEANQRAKEFGEGKEPKSFEQVIPPVSFDTPQGEVVATVDWGTTPKRYEEYQRQANQLKPKKGKPAAAPQPIEKGARINFAFHGPVSDTGYQSDMGVAVTDWSAESLRELAIQRGTTLAAAHGAKPQLKPAKASKKPAAPAPKDELPLDQPAEQKTPGTRLKFDSLETWLDGALALSRRKLGRESYAAIDAHMEALRPHVAQYVAMAPMDVVRKVAGLVESTASHGMDQLNQRFGAPPRGKRQGTVWEDLNQRLQNRIAKGGKPESEAAPKPEPPAAEEPPKAKPSDYGQSNEHFTKDAADAARARLKAKLGRLNAGLDPEMVIDGITLAGYHIEAGARKFADFARRMVEDLGEPVRPYLKQWYSAAYFDPRTEPIRGEMTPLAEVERTDVDQALKESGNVQRGGTDLERDRGAGQPAKPVGQAPVPAQAATPERPAGGRSAPARGAGGEPTGSPELPADGSPVVRAEGDFDLFGHPSRAETGVARGELPERSDVAGPSGPAFDPVADRATQEAAVSPSQLGDKRAAQAAANKIPSEHGDLANIRATLPFLTEGQQDDVHFAETRYTKPDGYGVLFTNGTGTGKTYTALGIAKRFERQGKRNILIVTPSDVVAQAFMEAAGNLDFPLNLLPDTQTAGTGPVITTYANLGQNNALANRKWDLVLSDEAHNLMQAKDGKDTAALGSLRALTLHPRGAWRRAEMLNPELAERVSSEGKPPRWKADPADVAAWSEAVKATRAEVDGAQGAARPRVALLSATPFAYEKDVDYAEGYLFDYPKTESTSAYNAGGGYERFMMQNFGYRMRYNKLTEPDANVDRSLLQVDFNRKLKREGVLSGRALDVPFDYNRAFVLVESAVGQKIDQAMDTLRDQFQPLADLAAKRFNYLARLRLLEAIKADHAVERARQELALGRKMVIFHNYIDGGGMAPFKFDEHADPAEIRRQAAVEREKGNQGEADYLESLANAYARPVTFNRKGESVTMQFNDLVREWNRDHPALASLDFSRMPSPIHTIQAAFPGAMVFNGRIPKAARRQALKLFQGDGNGHDILVVQADAGGAGLNAHDTTGKHERVLYNLGLPLRPVMATQQEGRVFRVGQASNAGFRYFNTGTSFERYTFAQTIARRAETAENLAMGEDARALRDSFINAFDNPIEDAPARGDNTGGKAADKRTARADPFDMAVTYYYQQQKKDARSKAREGIDYFATPEPVGLKMMQWADPHRGEDVLEPSAGHGAIARWAPEGTRLTMIEPSDELGSRALLVAGGKLERGRFEDHHIVNKYDAIVMNPPFGQGGATAIAHLAQAAHHLRDGGRIVILLPEGPAADKRFEKWMYEEETRKVKPLLVDPKLGPIFKGDKVFTEDDTKVGLEVSQWKDDRLWVTYPATANGPGGRIVIPTHEIVRVAGTGKHTETFKPAEGLYTVATIRLPGVTFKRAATEVRTRVVVLQRADTPEGVAKVPEEVQRDYSNIADIKELFDRIRDVDLRQRPEKPQPEPEAAPAPAGKQPKPPKPEPPGGYELAEGQTSNGKKTWIASKAAKVDREEYLELLAKAKALGGWYSGYSKPRGFHFRSPEDRAKFLDQVGGNPPKAEGEPVEIREDQAQYSGNASLSLPTGVATPKAGPPRVLGNVQPAGAVQGSLDFFAPKRQGLAPKRDVLSLQDRAKLDREVAHVRVGEFRTGITKVKSPEDAAHILAPLRKSAVEQMYVLALDAKGKPLEVIRHSIGGVGGAQMYPEVLAQTIARIKGISQIWMAHNHPSGNNNPSSADIAVTDAIVQTLEGSGIQLAGHLIFTPNARTARFFRTEPGMGTIDNSNVPIRLGPRHGVVPSTHPTLKRVPIEGTRTPLTNPRDMQRFVENLSPGVVLLDSQHRYNGFVPMSVDEMMSLRKLGASGTPIARELLAAIGKSGFSPAAVVVSDHAAAASNVYKYLASSRRVERVLDVFAPVPGAIGRAARDRESWAQVGQLPGDSGPAAFSNTPEGWDRIEPEARGLSKRTVQSVVDAANATAPSALPTAVHPTGDDAPASIRRLVERGANAVYDPTDGKIHFIADRFRSARDLARTWVHEQVGHHGARSVTSEEDWKGITAAVQKMRANPRLLDKAMQEALASAERRYYDADPETFANEFGAVMAERGITGSLWDRIVAAVRRFLRRVFKGLEWTDNELRDMLRRAREHTYGKGKESPTAEEAVARAAKSADPFYSALVESVARGKGAPKAADAAGWRGWLDGAQRRGEFKAAERDWMGLDQWLGRQQGKVTREALNAFVAENQVRLKDVELGLNSNKIDPQDRHQLVDSLYESVGRRMPGHFENGGELPPDFEDIAQLWAAGEVGDVNAASAFSSIMRRDYKPRAPRPTMLTELPAGYEPIYDRTGEGGRGAWGVIPDGQSHARPLYGWHPTQADAVADVVSHLNFERSDRWERENTVTGITSHDLDVIRTRMIGGSGAKWAQYTLPGGSNYRELLITKPVAPVSKEGMARRQAVFERHQPELDRLHTAAEQFDDTGAIRARGARERARDREANEAYQLPDDAHVFESAHFDQPNIIAHVRMTDRPTSDGKRMLFLEEVQSDWHQKGRKLGYSDPSYQVEMERLKAEWERLQDTIPGVGGDLAIAERARARQAEITDQMNAMSDRMTYGVPNAPFKREWPLVAMKRMLRYAAENGYQRIGWTTGKQQAERYNLAKHITRLVWVRSGNSGFTPKEHIETRYNEGNGSYESGTLKAFGKEGYARLLDRHMPEHELAGVVGAELAAKLLAQPPEYRVVDGTARTERTLEGLDLHVGGEGMRAFYDKILPNTLNDYLKQWGAKVGTTTIEDPEERAALADLRAGGENVPGNEGLEDQDKTFPPVHAIDITPAMADSVMEGQPLFNRPERARTHLEGLEREIQQLSDQVDRAYARGSRKTAEDLDALLAQRREEFDHALSDYEEREPNGDLEDDQPFDEAGVEEQLANAYARYLRLDRPGQHVTYGMTGADLVQNMRAVIDRGHGPTNFAARTEGKTDRQVLAAARDAYEAARARRQARGRITWPGAGGPPRQFASIPDDLFPDEGLWASPEERKLDDLLYKLQDKHIDLKRVQGEITKAVGALKPGYNPYLREELYHGRAAQQTEHFLESEFRPLAREMAFRGVSIPELEEYLHARHAQERNRQIAKINPEMPDYGSGMGNREAREYLDGLSPARRQALDAVADHVDRIIEGTEKLLVDSGLETQQTIDTWRKTYTFYVPLMRADMGETRSSAGTGQGFSVRGPASKRAMGSEREVVDILANIMLQRERTITRAEKNRVSIATYGLALKAPNADFWRPVDPQQWAQSPQDRARQEAELVALGLTPLEAKNVRSEPTERYINPHTGLVSDRINPSLRSRDNVLSLRMGGKDRFIFFNEHDPRAMRMAASMKNLDADQLGQVLGALAKFTRYFAAVNTQYNPVFGVVNLTRDVQEALINLTSTPIAGKQAELAAHVPAALAGVISTLRAHRAGNEPTSIWADRYRRFQELGGKTGYRDQFDDSEERARAIQREINRATEGKGMKAFHYLKEWLSDYNDAMENATRLAAFQTAIDAGMHPEEAASLSKNLTVNFNRKGQASTQAAALWAFFNASVQSTARLAETLNSPGGRKIIIGGLLWGALQAIILSLAGFDDKDPPEFVRDRNTVIPTGDGKYITIPMPLGYLVLPKIGRLLTEAMIGGGRSVADATISMIGTAMDAFSPISNAGMSLQSIAPTALDPLVALSENKDYTGRSIAKPDYNSLAPTPGFTRAKDNASAWSTEVAKAINYLSGGTDFTPGRVSPTPDQIDYLIGQATGGVGRELNKAVQTTTALLGDQDIPPYKIPLLGRFYGDTKAETGLASTFYQNVRELNMHKAELEGRFKTGQPTNAYMAENPTAMLMAEGGRAAEAISALNKERREALAAGKPPEEIRRISDDITRTMREFNDQVAAQRAKPAVNQ